VLALFIPQLERLVRSTLAAVAAVKAQQVGRELLLFPTPMLLNEPQAVQSLHTAQVRV
jgi:hypothetical protein